MSNAIPFFGHLLHRTAPLGRYSLAKDPKIVPRLCVSKTMSDTVHSSLSFFPSTTAFLSIAFIKTPGPHHSPRHPITTLTSSLLHPSLPSLLNLPSLSPSLLPPLSSLFAMSLAKYIFKIPGVHALVSTAARAYQASVAAELRRYGLRYDDLLNEYDEEVKHAIATLPPEELEMRNKRLKRALDLDVKQTFLSEDLQQEVDVWNPYLRSRVEALKQKRLERQTYD